MVCPQIIGQLSRSGFIRHYKSLFTGYKLYPDLEDINNIPFIKEVLMGNTLYILQECVNYLFICDHLVWIYYDVKQQQYNYKLINKFDISPFNDSSKISYSRLLDIYNHSVTIKYKGISVAEFQFHGLKTIDNKIITSGRQGMKFRFKLCNIIDLI